MEIEFGFLPENQQYSVGSYTIEPLADLAETVQAVISSGQISQGWYYPPLTRTAYRRDHEGEPPLVQATSFSLKETHRISSKGSGKQIERLAEFVVTTLGFTKGLRLMPRPWQHFYRVPITIGMLVDFCCEPADTELLLGLAHDFWLRHASTQAPEFAFGAFHWFLFGQSYLHPFELFNAQYIVLDTCWRIHTILNPPAKKGPPLRHGLRPAELCQVYGLAIPDWAQPTGSTCALAEIRNAFVHEGRYGNEPIGFDLPNNHTNIDYELTVFNARLLVALLGYSSDYTRSPVDTQQEYCLS